MALDGKIVEAREKMIELIKVYGMSETDFLKYLNASAIKAAMAISLVIIWIFILLKIKNWIFRKEIIS